MHLFWFSGHTKARWIQPISVFVSKSAASGGDLKKIALKALIILEEADARVITRVCNGSTPNNSLWNAFDIFLCIWPQS